MAGTNLLAKVESISNEPRKIPAELRKLSGVVKPKLHPERLPNAGKASTKKR